jgi:DNA-binding NarL/FixJ family response regulator
MPGRVLAVRPPRTAPSPNDAAATLFTDQASARQQPPFGVLIAHPYQVVAEGLGVMLDAQDDLAVLGVAHDGHQAVELAAKHEPTVLLLDAHMPGPDLATTLRAVRAASPATKVMMLSADTRRETIAEALAAGADGFLTKDASSRQVATAIRKLACGKGSIVTAAEPVSRPARDPSVDLRVRTLSSREREILGLLANGWSNRRIAEECFLSLNTVRTHVRDVLVKLGLHSKLEAIVFAFEQGLVPPQTDSAFDDPYA